MQVVTPGNAPRRAAPIGFPHKLHNFVSALAFAAIGMTPGLRIKHHHLPMQIRFQSNEK
jgi:hypothetical protein